MGQSNAFKVGAEQSMLRRILIEPLGGKERWGGEGGGGGGKKVGLRQGGDAP